MTVPPSARDALLDRVGARDPSGRDARRGLEPSGPCLGLAPRGAPSWLSRSLRRLRGLRRHASGLADGPRLRRRTVPAPFTWPIRARAETRTRGYTQVRRLLRRVSERQLGASHGHDLDVRRPLRARRGAPSPGGAVDDRDYALEPIEIVESIELEGPIEDRARVRSSSSRSCAGAPPPVPDEPECRLALAGEGADFFPPETMVDEPRGSRRSSRPRRPRSTTRSTAPPDAGGRRLRSGQTFAASEIAAALADDPVAHRLARHPAAERAKTSRSARPRWTSGPSVLARIFRRPQGWRSSVASFALKASPRSDWSKPPDTVRPMSARSSANARAAFSCILRASPGRTAAATSASSLRWLDFMRVSGHRWSAAPRRPGRLLQLTARSPRSPGARSSWCSRAARRGRMARDARARRSRQSARRARGLRRDRALSRDLPAYRFFGVRVPRSEGPALEGLRGVRGVRAGLARGFALFRAIKRAHEAARGPSWDRDVRERRPGAVDAARRELAEDIAFETFAQYVFDVQWSRLRAYASERGVALIGDVPIFVAHDSADVWQNPRDFFLDDDGAPSFVAGVPPDYFSKTGQRWGNPLYRWKRMEKNGYAWWIARLAARSAGSTWCASITSSASPATGRFRQASLPL